jgi:hypothetical protein
MFGLTNRTQSAAAASPSKHIASPQYTQAFRDSNDASSTRTRLSKAISSKSHSDRMQVRVKFLVNSPSQSRKKEKSLVKGVAKQNMNCSWRINNKLRRHANWYK